MIPPSPTIILALDRSAASIEHVHEAIAELWMRHPRITDTDRMAFETALIELATNVIRHSVLDGTSDSHLRLAVSVSALTAEIVDQGRPFPGHLDHFALPGTDAESGRGMAVISALTNVFEYTRIDAPNSWTPGQNHWRIVRRLTEPAPSS